MTFNIFAVSTELAKAGITSADQAIHEEILIAGKSAGMCYCNDNFNRIVEDDEGAERRFKRVIATHHHSIAEHGHIEVVITGISKVLAMILNNQRVYCTSEKSGRYTTMTGASDVEKTEYDKWYNRITDILNESNIRILENEKKEKVIDKLAKENARYMIDIFSPIVSMCYTCSLLQWNYLAQWMTEAIPRLKKISEEALESINPIPTISKYATRLAREFEEFVNCIRNSGLIVPGLINMKGRSIDTLLDNREMMRGFNPKTNVSSMGPILSPHVDVLDDVVIVRYSASFAALAQLQRHRTSKFVMSILRLDWSELGKLVVRNTVDTYNFFVPKFITSGNDIYEWTKSLNSIITAPDDACVLPIATRIEFKMVTTFEDFRQIMMERCCGRAQFETYDVVSQIHKKLYGTFSAYRNFCASYGITGECVSKCKMQKCNEPCRFIADGLDNRTM